MSRHSCDVTVIIPVFSTGEVRSIIQEGVFRSKEYRITALIIMSACNV